MNHLEQLIRESASPDTTALLRDLGRFVRRYVVLSDAQLEAVVLWIAHTHAFEAAEATPYLHVTSAEMQSGKTRMLEVLELVVAHAVKTGGTTAAALARAVAQDPPPTLLLDETDNAFRRDREYVAALMGILNDGYRRGGQTLLCLPPKWEPSFLSVFAPKAFAGIGELPDTVASRSIRIELKRKLDSEQVERFRRREVAPAGDALRHRLETWAQQVTDVLADARPMLPEDLGDRAQDVWESLLAIAEHAGADEAARACAAAVELSGTTAPETSRGTQLLSDIRRVFEEGGISRMKTAALIDALSEIEESPWGDWHGRQISAQQLSKLLQPFSIRTMPVKVDGVTVRGYKVEQFEDAWLRYLPVDGVTRVTSRLAPRGGGNAGNAGNASQAQRGSAIRPNVDEHGTCKRHRDEPGPWWCQDCHAPTVSPALQEAAA